MILRKSIVFVVGLIVGAFLGFLSSFHLLSSTQIKFLPPLKSFGGTSAEFFNNASGIGLGTFAVYSVSGAKEALGVSILPSSFPVVFILKTGSDSFLVSVADKQQNIFSCDLKDEKFETISYTNIEFQDRKVTSIDINADGIYDLVARQSKNSTETMFFFEGLWYPYKVENGKWMIQTSDGWCEIVKGAAGFQFR